MIPSAPLTVEDETICERNAMRGLKWEHECAYAHSDRVDAKIMRDAQQQPLYLGFSVRPNREAVEVRGYRVGAFKS